MSTTTAMYSCLFHIINFSRRDSLMGKYYIESRVRANVAQ